MNHPLTGRNFLHILVLGIIMNSYLEKSRIRGQAMMETMIVAAVLALVMLGFGLVVSGFLDHGYRTLRLISMEYP